MSQPTRVSLGCPNPACPEYVPDSRGAATEGEPVNCTACGTLCPVTIVPPGGAP